jgi:benzoate-CoA ligase family protein
MTTDPPSTGNPPSDAPGEAPPEAPSEAEQAPDFRPPERFNIADYFLDDRIREGKGANVALRTDEGTLTYADVQAMANRFGNLLREAGVEPEQRILIALPDGPDFVAALFGIFKIGAVAVMVNPHLRRDAIDHFLRYTRAVLVLAHPDTLADFEAAARDAPRLKALLVTATADFDRRLAAASDRLETFPSHRDDAALWLFSGGTSGHPKAVVQSHTSYANTTECYAKRVIGYAESDVSISVPKLFFGYATGANLFFPFAVGASAVLFPDRCTPEALFDRIERHRPTLLVNVPTMIQQMLADPSAPGRDLSSLRLATSAGEALPVELYHRWKEAFGVELLDGLGTAEMWHVFLSNRPGRVRPGTLGVPVPGFDVRVRDEEGNDLPPGEVGYLWVRGNSRAIGYWQQAEKTRHAFRGEWYVSEDMLSRDAEGWFSYRGRADDMLKVSGKWLSPQEVENCLLQHPEVREVAVVGAVEEDGLVRPHAYVVRETQAGATHDPAPPDDDFREALRTFARERLESYKVPRTIVCLETLPRTHLGKVDRGRLRAGDGK